MGITIILVWGDFTYYVDIPNIGRGTPGTEFIEISEEESELLTDHFVVPMFSVCDSLLDYGDVDFYNPEKCKKMSAWLEEQIPIVDNPTLKGIYERINYACHKSIELNTGFVMDL